MTNRMMESGTVQEHCDAAASLTQMLDAKDTPPTVTVFLTAQLIRHRITLALLASRDEQEATA